MPKTIPCLWFDNQAQQAAELYTSLFPNSRITGVTHYGPDTPGPEGKVMTVDFELDGQQYVGLNGGPLFTFSEAVSFQIMCRDQEEIDHYWDGLSGDGGQEGPCGWVKDRFGLSWQVVPTALPELLNDPDAERAQRAMQAMLKMRKLDVDELRRAADGHVAA
jgi:predicted 3-demethylubiquinone-9 3-methyltransferase (glyoxalase superfamily)